ncbi:MAG TPA: RsmE family RNA methyltransferase [Acidimicrobiales bacterium]|nr:RsmE family RNA methyltransferase [Acidimicrobiales bacterium]
MGVVPDDPLSILRSAAALVFVDDPASPVLDPEDERHLASSLRLRDGEAVIACDGRGSYAETRVSASRAGGRRGATLSLTPTGPVLTTAAPQPPVTICFALSKGDRPEWTVQKLTEMGVDRLVPVITERTVVRPDGHAALQRVERFRRVAREAAMQSRRTFLPEILPITDLRTLAAVTGGPVAMAVPGGGPPALSNAVVLVGPEGGFSEAEMAAAADTVGLGPTVLRSETAAIVVASLLTALRSGVVGPASPAAQ